MNVRFFLGLTTLLLIFSCKKPEDRACFKKAGEIKFIQLHLENSIDTLFLNDNLYYNLIPSEESKIELTGPENLISFIDITSSNGKLIVENKNKCNFLRSYKHEIHADIYVSGITYIEYRGSKELKSSATLSSNELRLEIKDGGGDVDLTLENGYTSAVVSSGVGSFKLSGKTMIGFLNCNSNSYCDASEFISTEKLTVNSNTVGEMLINAHNTVFFAEIHQSGNIKYIGEPIYKELKKYGKGLLINLK